MLWATELQSVISVVMLEMKKKKKKKNGGKMDGMGDYVKLVIFINFAMLGRHGRQLRCIGWAS